jgi:hypothetical protein
VFAVAAGVVWGIARLGDEARKRIGPRERYLVRFADIECESPAGLERLAFLSEVRYVAAFPDSFQSLDPELKTKLTAAFTAHPWVADVEDVTLDPQGKVRVALRFRVPMLTVRTNEGGSRVLDASGVLLPAGASTVGVAELVSPVATPIPLAGQTWRDPDVKRALELVLGHSPRLLEKSAQGWRLTMNDGKTLLVER